MGEEESMDLWERLAASLECMPEEIEADRRRAKTLFAELLAQPRMLRESMAANLERLRSIALAELLLDHSFKGGAESAELAELALVVTGVLDTSGTAAGLVEQMKARCWAAIGNALRVAGNLAKAEAAYRQASYHLATSPDPLEESLFYRLRALLLRDQGKWGAAVAVQEKAVELLHGFGRPVVAAISLIELAALYLDRDNVLLAVGFLRSAALALGSEFASEIQLRDCKCH
jgi:tetratricopeptide (TPR) repeat protein